MSILSTTEIVEHLNLASLDGKTSRIVKWVEAGVKRDIGRRFEEANYLTSFDVRRDQDLLELEDWPVSEFTMLEKVTSRETDGTPTYEEVGAYRYVVYSSKGLLKYLEGSLDEGRQIYRATYTAGFSESDIANDAHDDIVILKGLLLSVLEREYMLTHKGPKRHMFNESFDGESTRYRFSYDPDQLRKLSMLTRNRF